MSVAVGKGGSGCVVTWLRFRWEWWGHMEVVEGGDGEGWSSLVMVEDGAAVTM